MKSTDLPTMSDIEEINAGLPQDAPAPASIHETFEVSRFLLQESRKLELKLVRVQRVDTLLADIVTGFRRLLGCSEVELLLHDPIGRLKGMVSDWSSIYGMVKFTADSTEVVSLYSEMPGIHSIDGHLADAYGVLEAQAEKYNVYMLPLIESGVTVGSLHCADPKARLLDAAANLEVLHGLLEMIPWYLARAIDSQLSSELMLLDPVTHLTNRVGLERELERELGRTRRSNRPVSAVAITIFGLEDMSNLSQRHIKEGLLRKVAAILVGTLRTTDVLGRIADNAFGVIVSEAPPDRVADIASRSQKELDGAMLDNDLGGMVELKASASYVVWAPDPAPASLPDGLAHRLFEAVLTAANSASDPDAPVIRVDAENITGKP